MNSAALRGRFGATHEWHLDLKKTGTVGKLGSYTARPESKQLANLSAIRPTHRRAFSSVVAKGNAGAPATLLNSCHRCGSNVTATLLPVCYQGGQFGRLRLDLSL